MDAKRADKLAGKHEMPKSLKLFVLIHINRCSIAANKNHLLRELYAVRTTDKLFGEDEEAELGQYIDAYIVTLYTASMCWLIK